MNTERKCGICGVQLDQSGLPETGDFGGDCAESKGDVALLEQAAVVQQEPPQPTGFDPGWPFPVPQAAVVQQEPVAWRYQDARGNYRYCGYKAGFDKEYPLLKPVALYTHPAQQAKPQQPADHFPDIKKMIEAKPLSEEQKQKLIARLRRQEGWDGDGWDLAIIEATEAAHGIKE